MAGIARESVNRILGDTNDVRFWGNSGHRDFRAPCLLLTQSGHRWFRIAAVQTDP